MKRLYLFLIVLAFKNCYSATGSASDEELTVVAVIVFLMLPVIMAYSIKYFKHTVHRYITRKKHVEQLNH
jgi:hypothetical protein